MRPDHPCLAEADVRRVERVVRNLVTNAIDHTGTERAGGDIVVLVAGDDHAAAIAVRDYGVGLAPGEAAMVFNRFWRADPARARTSGGTGLGLSIALEDTHLHGGWLQAWGRPGEGAQFRLTLPRRAGGRAAPQPAAAGAGRRHGARLMRRPRRAPLARRWSALVAAGCSPAACRCPAPGPVVETQSDGGISVDQGELHQPQAAAGRATPAPTSSAASWARCRRRRSRPRPRASSSPRTPPRPGRRTTTVTYAGSPGWRRRRRGCR